MNKIDLHMHSTNSDGKFTTKQIIDEAVRNKVEIISITDHDTTEGYNEELFEYARKNNIRIIPGVEISTKTNKSGIHVLGYNFDLENEEFRTELKKIRNQRHDYLHKVSARLIELGYKVNVEKLDKIDAVTKAHISLDIIENKENEENLFKEFSHIPNKGEFIETIMNEGCKAYVKKNTVTPKEAAIMIRKAGGKVVLAHPVAYANEDGLTEDDIQEIVNEMKPDGIEANYIYVNRNSEVIDETKRWNNFAKKNRMIATIGTDFHRKDGIRPEIGFANMNLKLAEEENDNIIRFILES